MFCFDWCIAGYIGSVSFLNTILQVVEKLRSINPNLIYGRFCIFLMSLGYLNMVCNYVSC